MDEKAAMQAREALKNFRTLQPTLNRYAQVLTGRPNIRVEASATSNGATDGKKIYYRPPISLGKKMRHFSWMCDKRDEKGVMRCDACAQREKVLVTIYHEIAHIWFDSFESVTDIAKKLAIKAAIGERGGKYADGVKKRLESVGSSVGYMGLAAQVSPFLPTLLNALEDARVNRELFKALPGTKVMFDANTAEIFELGVEQLDKTGVSWELERWSDRPLNMQALIGVFCMASGYNFETWLNDWVVHQLRDPELVSLVAQLEDATSVDTTFTLSFPILARLRELGFCRSEEDPEDDYVPPPPADPGEGEDEPGNEPEEEGDGDGSDESEQGDGDDEASGGGGDTESADDGSDGADSGAGADRDESPDESEEEVGDSGEAGAGEPDGGSGGSEAPDGSDDEFADGGEEADGRSGSDAGAADASSDEVPDDVSSGDGASGSGDVEGGEPVEGSSDSDRGHDGDGAGPGDVDTGAEAPSDLDGLPGEDSGESDHDESGDSSKSAGHHDVQPGDADRSSDGLIDSGKFEKSTRVEGDPPPMPDIDFGTADEVEIVVHEIGAHEPPDSVEYHSHDDGGEFITHRDHEDQQGDGIIKIVIAQGVYFEMPSVNIGSIRVFDKSNPYEGNRWLRGITGKAEKISYGIDAPDDDPFDAPESVVAPATTRARIVFADNARGKAERNLRRGRVDASSLARKAPFNDPKMFKQARLPGREDYFVGIGIDISGSTIGENIALAKRVAFAEADMLTRLGIPFFMYAHSGNYGDNGVDLHIHTIKAPGDAWSEEARKTLREMRSDSVNLDGHTLEVYRKFLMEQKATKKILHYYSDGAMPCENYDEELEILQREIKTYARMGIILEGVGIRTDAPAQHGLPTVQVDEVADVMKVVESLEKRLTRR